MKRLSLCIGNNDYKILPKLNCARNDAEAVAKKLKNLRFDVRLAFDLDRDSLIKTINDVEDELGNYDQFLLFYAGHGFQVNGDNLLVPIDFNNNDPRNAKYNAYMLNDLMENLKAYPDTAKAIILDACRESLGVRGLGNNFVPIFAPQGTIIAFSTSPGQTAKERGKHGLYTDVLLRYMDMPRKPIETVFKDVRVTLARETNGSQIPWEHTSLIADFYLNPGDLNTGITYISDAYADGSFIFDRNSVIKEIVEGLKSHNWDEQSRAVKKIRRIDFNKVTAEELFILGRNIYQAAVGNCFDCMGFIDDFKLKAYIPDAIKIHILNGMAYEIYFDHEGNGRIKFKTGNGRSSSVIKLLEMVEYHESAEFISSQITTADLQVFYYPGITERVDVDVYIKAIDGGLAVEDILYNGKSIYYNISNSEKPVVIDFNKEWRRTRFETDLIDKMAAAEGYVRFHYIGEKVKENSVLLLPYNGYSLFPRDGE